jgi:hypothetical protein
VSPVPPYTTPTDVVAETTPAFACSGPLSEPIVSPLVKFVDPFTVKDPSNVEAPVPIFKDFHLLRFVPSVKFALLSRSGFSDACHES